MNYLEQLGQGMIDAHVDGYSHWQVEDKRNTSNPLDGVAGNGMPRAKAQLLTAQPLETRSTTDQMAWTQDFRGQVVAQSDDLPSFLINMDTDVLDNVKPGNKKEAPVLALVPVQEKRKTEGRLQPANNEGVVLHQSDDFTFVSKGDKCGLFFKNGPNIVLDKDVLKRIFVKHQGQIRGLRELAKLIRDISQGRIAAPKAAQPKSNLALMGRSVTPFYEQPSVDQVPALEPIPELPELEEGFAQIEEISPKGYYYTERTFELQSMLQRVPQAVRQFVQIEEMPQRKNVVLFPAPVVAPAAAPAPEARNYRKIAHQVLGVAIIPAFIALYRANIDKFVFFGALFTALQTHLALQTNEEIAESRTATAALTLPAAAIMIALNINAWIFAAFMGTFVAEVAHMYLRRN